MKKILFILFGIICLNSYSQNVMNKYINKNVSTKDGQFVISNKFEIARNDLENIETMISMLKSNDNDSIITIISLSIFQKPSIYVNKGDTCLIKLSNDRILIFKSVGDCAPQEGGGFNLISPDYMINNDDVQQLKTYPINKIRIQNGSSYKDWEKISKDTNTKFTNFCSEMDKCMNERKKNIMDDF